ncbi:hypothetical protein CDCA_CDCA17G4335 [Cyanidium caldarium]|uniref:RRM domain-containing protein n=1 Tax=Cyanidium caldarium TaxID=2771 RepID=A0AAV9J143_CYACA|nr:hypothetical protein CDCA_CDCA17G4335 [Cyanidium caldarium]
MSVRESSTTSSSNGSGGGGGGDEQRKLFVGGLSWDTDETSLRRHFEQFGSVEQAVIKRDRVTNQPRGFGFVTFADGAAAQRVAAMERHEVDGRRVEAKMAHPRGSDEGGSGASVGTSAGDSSNEADSGVEAGEAPQRGKLFVGGLPGACNDRELRAYFEPYGTVSEAHVMYDHQTGHSRGFGFVTFADEAAAAQVLAEPPGYHLILGKRVEVKPAVSRKAMEAATMTSAAAAAAAANNYARHGLPMPVNGGGPAGPGLPLPQYGYGFVSYGVNPDVAAQYLFGMYGGDLECWRHWAQTVTTVNPMPFLSPEYLGGQPLAPTIDRMTARPPPSPPAAAVPPPPPPPHLHGRVAHGRR